MLKYKSPYNMKNINIKHLQGIIAVFEKGSITAAANFLHLSQPALTQGIHKIEKGLDATCFHRSKNGIYPTEAGNILRFRLERGLENLKSALAPILRERGGKPITYNPMQMVTTAQLTALSSVVEQRSFALAAHVTGLAAPTLHRAARDMEQILGVTLFERTSYGVQPTRHASQLAIGVKLLLHEIDQARAEISAHKGIEAGKTCIGAMPLARSGLVPAAVSQFSKEHPDHRVSIIDAPYENLLLGLRRGDIDFLIGALREALPAGDIIQEPLFDDPLAIIMRAGHPLSAIETPDIRQMIAYPWVMPRRNSPLYQQFLKMFRNAGHEPPSNVIECNSLSAARVLLLESDRLMLLSEAQTVLERKTGLLLAKPHPSGKITRAIGMTYRRDWAPTKTQRKLTDVIHGLTAHK